MKLKFPSRTLPKPPKNEASETARPIPKKRWSSLSSPLTWRILAVNVMAPVILVAGLFYLDRYKNELIAADLESLRIRAGIFAAALGEGATEDDGLSVTGLSAPMASQLVRGLAMPARVRARLFNPNGALMADSRLLLATSTVVQVEDLPEADMHLFTRFFRAFYDFFDNAGFARHELPLYRERILAQAADYEEVSAALNGEAASGVRMTEGHRLVLSVAVPVQRYKRVLGAVLLSSPGDDIQRALFTVRLAIFQAFCFALAITTLLSLYLAASIAKPIRSLAMAAERVRRDHGRHLLIPDLTRRSDEIGELSGALRDMTSALWRRMDAVEAFAADVAHEIKNPLTSLKSAVETCSRIQNPEQQRKLMAIIEDDVGRLDRLISDISDASRIDAELSRAEVEPLSIRALLEGLVLVYRDASAAGGVEISLTTAEDDPLSVAAIESRIAQVVRNLLANALSFSPKDGLISLSARREGKNVIISVEDQGPGIPENKLDAIFERFYSARPATEKFGTHSGLGLSISRQIVEAHGGAISAANRTDGEGRIIGSRFIVLLPLLE
ncbi:histidine kinase [Alphaproteobacteria bacterium]|nr:histidine kinase [Alphaproteobacteria bacterium]